MNKGNGKPENRTKKSRKQKDESEDWGPDRSGFMYTDYEPVEDCQNKNVMTCCLKCNQCGRFDNEEVSNEGCV